MADRVLPALFVLLEVRKSLGNVIVNLAERRSLAGRILEEKSSKLKEVSADVARYQMPINLSALSSPERKDFHIFRAVNHRKMLSSLHWIARRRA